MALRATSLTCKQAYDGFKAQGVHTIGFMTSSKTAITQATCSSRVVIGILEHCVAVLSQLATYAAVPGIVDYARAQESDPAYDVVAEYQNLRNAYIALRDGIANGFPKDANGWFLHQQFSGNQITYRNFTQAQLASTVPLVDAVLAAVS